MYKNSVKTSKKTPHFTIIKIACLMLFKEINVVYVTLKYKMQPYWLL
jgi:hypothetical protein